MDISSVKEVVSVRRLSDVSRLVSNPRTFLKARVGSGDSGLLHGAGTYLYMVGVGLVFLYPALALSGESLSTPIPFALSTIVFVFVAAFVAYCACWIVRADATYRAVLEVFLYTQGISFVIAVLALCVLVAGIDNGFDQWRVAFGFLALMAVTWRVAVWWALSSVVGMRAGRAVLSFMLFSFMYIPVMYTFMALSTVVGRAA